MGVFKELFEQSAQMRWIKTIDKACSKYIRIDAKLNRQWYVVSELLRRYKEIYGENLREVQKEGADHDLR